MSSKTHLLQTNRSHVACPGGEDTQVAPSGLRIPYPLGPNRESMWEGGEYALAERCMDVPIGKEERIRLLGVTEDVVCNEGSEHTEAQECRLLCNACKVPICRECQIGLHAYDGHKHRSTIPRSLANDHMYRYVAKLLVD